MSNLSLARALHRLDDVLAKAETLVMLVVFAGLALLLGFNIVSRNFFQVSYQEILEITPTMVLWLALLGASLAVRRDRHIKLELVLRFMPPRWQRRCRSVAAAFAAVIMAVLFHASFAFVEIETEMFGAKGYLTVIFPLFFFVAAFRFLLLATGFGRAPTN